MHILGRAALVAGLFAPASNAAYAQRGKHLKECRKKLVLKVCLKSFFFPHMKPPK